MSEHITQGGGDRLLVLAVDTSTAALAAALVRGHEVLREVQSLAERNHSVHTVSTVQAMLAECGIKPDELDGIAIGRGPGSYTGMRIAVSLGKTLAWVWNKPLVGVSSLEALGYGAWQNANSAGSPADGANVADVFDAADAFDVADVFEIDDASDTAQGASSARHLPDGYPAVPEAGQGPVWLVPIMDARRGQVYTASFAARTEASAEAGALGDGTWKRLSKDGIRLMREWVDELAAAIEAAGECLRPSAVWIAGELELHESEADRLQALCPGIQVRKLPIWLEGRAVAALGAARLAAGESDDVHAFAPNYTQLTEAEVKLQERTAAAKQAAAEGAVQGDAN
ncbi:tRNA (adenosine(37)-N6)-threonylcarbamoyltransferase complex dimerization subunit type 1 TsaB [Paenibacillus rhizovicinus]|uniref:tRNA (Adenosine(37)-N6)-threonylcarbamoyltransferase complex dimerization subunit type 1 TsaB n=1 Tax=Paenibacillus rhizovicinus TaxID=2704463 RepID=A0A6C0P8Z3_9BACL|nr:tRNA (adenosine(37)-N6)-threonylcarbamoyltransferase complex dimerization subunit type 1 TsaB [Paenibacillus rhizovicinus]QHW33012.1 tRNA (adenosine(37)-N6)-threonylcarbamoyltransferase complex dimerization subunit type 1 TsaB [Paenibacillus rhizovicinus]